MGKPCVLVVHNKRTRFVRLDEEMLADRYRVVDCQLTKQQALNPVFIRRLVLDADLVFGWFASWHTLLPFLLAKKLGKPALLVSGGYDVANLPEIGYGHQRGGLKKWVSRWVMRLADCVVVNSEFSKREALENAKQNPAHVRVIYHGVPDTFSDWEGVSKEAMALTVGNLDADNLWRKGLGPFACTAPLLPEVRFTLVGDWQDETHRKLQSNAPGNLTLTGWVDEEAWREYYLRSAVYVQASQHEGFGMSLAEGMLAGCFPVVTRAGAIPEVVGDCGYYVNAPEPEALAEGIRRGLTISTRERHQIRERILHHFTMEQRARSFFDVMDSLL